ncbi:tetratricopeptide repeat protein [Brumimicrobium glaciale]|jgi:tetratricopeptide (TPR) repeat protein|uniref:Tetratricopeptide repeat protein n=1 Tax=Brumimicrobium glaciale TaxID=200475 RepID=A0A4Q4KRN9_9FLAO|nr:tetratricopeptide repeat protein [Brumimicrobium glaciale]RYM35973.1 tetratricopeptide repeat protein [Brumimicrobium glaciale]
MIKNRFLYTILGFGLLFSCTSENKTDDDQFFVKEEVNIEKDELAQISDSLEKNPENINLWIRQGEICKENMNFSCALNAGAKAFRIDSTNIKARQLYAWTLINKPETPRSDIERAKRHYQYILSLKPKDPQTLVELANTYSLTGDFKTAIKYINDALRMDERYRDAYVLKGSIYKTLEKNDLAVSSYQTALQIDPEFFIGHLNTGWLLTSMGKHKLALQYYQNAVDLKPENLNAIYGVAKSLQDLGEYDNALKEYRKIEKFEPDFYITYFNQAYIKHYYQKELDSAAYYYDKALDVNPQYTPAWFQMGELYYEQDRFPEAGRYYAEALKIDKNFIPAKEAAEKLRKKY